MDPKLIYQYLGNSSEFAQYLWDSNEWYAEYSNHPEKYLYRIYLFPHLNLHIKVKHSFKGRLHFVVRHPFTNSKLLVHVSYFPSSPFYKAIQKWEKEHGKNFKEVCEEADEALHFPLCNS